MKQRLLQHGWAYLLVCSLTAFAFDGLHVYRRNRMQRTQLVKLTYCEVWGGTIFGYFCPEPDASGGGGSEAR